MKKKSLILLALFVNIGLVQAQFYVKAGGGYGLPIAQQVLGEKQLEGSSGNTSYDKKEEVRGSYGAGATFGVGAGYMFSKYLGVDLNINYLLGKSYTTGYFYKYDFGRQENSTKTTSKVIFLNPSFIISGGDGTKLPYARLGVVMAAPKMEESEYDYYDGDGVYTATRKYDIKGGLSMGFSGAAGMSWVLKNSIKLYTELNFVSMTYFPEERVMTSSNSNGVSNIDQFTESQKRIKYVKTLDLSKPNDENKPTEVLRESKPYSSLSLQVGIIYVFGGISVD